MQSCIEFKSKKIRPIFKYKLYHIILVCLNIENVKLYYSVSEFM